VTVGRARPAGLRTRSRRVSRGNLAVAKLASSGRHAKGISMSRAATLVGVIRPEHAELPHGPRTPQLGAIQHPSDTRKRGRVASRCCAHVHDVGLGSAMRRVPVCQCDLRDPDSTTGPVCATVPYSAWVQ
jgi:hypothetical protein